MCCVCSAVHEMLKGEGRPRAVRWPHPPPSKLPRVPSLAQGAPPVRACVLWVGIAPVLSAQLRPSEARWQCAQRGARKRCVNLAGSATAHGACGGQRPTHAHVESSVHVCVVCTSTLCCFGCFPSMHTQTTHINFGTPRASACAHSSEQQDRGVVRRPWRCALCCCLPPSEYAVAGHGA